MGKMMITKQLIGLQDNAKYYQTNLQRHVAKANTALSVHSWFDDVEI